MITLYALITGYILDLLIGDPEGLPHPVRYMGNMISGGEKFLRSVSCRSERAAYFCGMFLTVGVVGISWAVPFTILLLAGEVNPVLRFVLEALMCYQILATKALKKESMKVFYELEQGKLPEARVALSRIVGRDTENLSPKQVTKAAVKPLRKTYPTE
jgi:adenosylcobinamide-phosphate synthase